MNFENRLKQLRQEKNLTRKELANKLQLSYWALSKYETGERFPDPDILNKIADYFSVSLDYLMGKTDIRNPKEPQLPTEFETPEEAMEFILRQPAIMGFGGFDIDKMSDEEVLEFANE